MYELKSLSAHGAPKSQAVSPFNEILGILENFIKNFGKGIIYEIIFLLKEDKLFSILPDNEKIRLNYQKNCLQYPCV